MITLQSGQHIHFIGIGGTGLSAIARVLLQHGFRISGSDRNQGILAAALAAEEATVHHGHDAAYVTGADIVLRSSAIPDDHVEVQAARRAGIPVVKRSDMIAQVMAGQRAICIAGTHGKTTTTSMIAHTLMETELDPSYIVGGTLANSGHNAASGQGEVFVIEADEYDYMFLGLNPDIAVVTNVEWDHPDFFSTASRFTEAFQQFVARLSDTGILVACADDPGSMALAKARQQAGLPTLTYGIQSTDADWRASDLGYSDGNLTFSVWHNNELQGDVVLGVPGEHNVLNALAALIVADLQGVSFVEAVTALSTFKGAGRRFDVRADIEGIAIVDDYAHHPTAIRKMIDVAQARYPNRDIWVVWQPHTYSRTQEYWDEFVGAFANANHVIVTAIYAARENPVPGVTGAALVEAMSYSDGFFAPTFADAVQHLSDKVTSPAVVLIMSAGDAPQIGIDYLSYIESQRP